MKSKAACVKASPLQVQLESTQLQLVNAMHERQEMISTLAAELVAGINGDIDQPPKVSSVLAWTIELLADETYALVSALPKN